MNVAFTSLFYEYRFKPDRVINSVLGLSLGAGDVNMEYKNQAVSSVLFPYGEQYFFFAQPQGGLELNLLPRLKASLGVGYVWVSSLEYRAIYA